MTWYDVLTLAWFAALVAVGFYLFKLLHSLAELAAAAARFVSIWNKSGISVTVRHEHQHTVSHRHEAETRAEVLN